MAQADTSPAPAKPAARPPTRRPHVSAADAPKPSGSVDVADLMAEGPLPDVVIGDATRR